MAHRGCKVSDEAKLNMSKAQKGRIITSEHKKKLSVVMTGRKLCAEHKKKLSEANKGYKQTDEHKRKISEASKGHKCTDATKRKISEANKGRTFSDVVKKRMSNGMKGRAISEETKKKMSESQRGDKGPNWQGGISSGQYCTKFNNMIKEEIREKYGRACLICGKTEGENGRKLDVHHIDYNKEQGCEEHKWKLVPLCRSCHSKTSNGDREYYEGLIQNKLEETIRWIV